MSRCAIAYRSVLLRLVCLGGILFTVLCGQAQQTKEELARTRKQLEEEIEYTNRLLDQTQQTKKTSLRDLQLLTSRIRKREALINTISQEINQVDRQIAEDSRQIRQQSQELKALKEEYARMIYYAHKITRSQDRLAFIFSARDFNQAYQRLKYYRQYTAYRRKQAERIREAQIALSLRMNELENTRASKQKLADSERQEKENLNREKSQKDQTIQNLSRKERELLVSLRTKQESVKKLQAEIERIIAEEARSASSRKRDAGAEAAEMKLSSSFAANRGKLPWPADQGVVTSTFGEHQHPVLKYVKVNNNGIDIMLSRNGTVKAVFSGTVSRVLSIANLNQVVMIRHGQYLTVYSNLDEVYVVNGQSVSTGEVIGRAHYDSEEGKSEINFQVWMGKTILNPQEWLRGY